MPVIPEKFSKFIKLLLFCIVVGLLIYPINKFWGIYTGTFIFVYYWLNYTIDIRTINNGILKKIFDKKFTIWSDDIWASFANSTYLLVFTGIITFIIAYSFGIIK